MPAQKLERGLIELDGSFFLSSRKLPRTLCPVFTI